MQINIPDDLRIRIEKRTAEGRGLTEADVIRKALDSLDWCEGERAAIQEGIDAMQAGKTRPFKEFDREFRAEQGIKRD